MQCPNCGQDISDGSLICMHCAAPVPQQALEPETAQDPAEDAVPDEGGLSLEKIIAVIAKMKSLLDADRFEQAIFERMTLDLVRDYLSAMDDGTRLIFVSYEIENSELAPFLSPGMLEKLRRSVMDSLANK